LPLDQPLDQLGQVGVDLDGAPRRPGEQMLGYRLPQPVPIGTDPESASRQFTSDIGNESILRTDDEPDHPIRVQPFARCDAAAKRAGFVILFVGRVRLDFVHLT